jgi:hypothetical protein
MCGCNLGQHQQRKPTHRTAKSAKGWRKAAPKGKRQRRAVISRCGRSAFLMPDALKFPVVGKSGGCAPDCRAVRAALYRARQHGYVEVAGKARALGRRLGCSWAR